MRTFEEDLQRAEAYHGHLCSGQILGVRMARLGLKTLGIENPDAYRNLIVYVETDRCLADAIGTVTGCKLGKRTLKWMDYGKTAATFLDLTSGRAVRIHRRKHISPEGDLKAFFEQFSDEELFVVTPVHIDICRTELPGPPAEVAVCAFCGEDILDGRQLEKDGKCCCRACYDGGYYRKTEE